MIIEFSVQNFRSIKELQTISFKATSLKSSKDLEALDKRNVVDVEGQRLLKTVGVYGANASGKSNIVNALVYFKEVIRGEASSESNLDRVCDPFLFQDEPFWSESMFQIIILLSGKRFRYGFTVSRNRKSKIDPDAKHSKHVITNEWFYGTKGKNMTKYFLREGMELDKDQLPNGNQVPDMQYEHTLFLTHAAAFDKDGDISEFRSYISGWLVSNFGGFETFRRNALLLVERENRKNEFLKLLSAFNLDYNDIIVDRDEESTKETNLPPVGIYMTKLNNSTEVRLDLDKSESEGTRKLFDVAGLMLRAFTMAQSAVLVIDEIDSNFHPSLLIKIIELFNDPEMNKSNCQLLFTSHDTNLMHPAIMRRDQFYFSEKDDNDSTRLYSLADLKGIRNDADFARQYLAGFYGAVPRIKDIDKQNKDNE